MNSFLLMSDGHIMLSEVLQKLSNVQKMVLKGGVSVQHIIHDPCTIIDGVQSNVTYTPAGLVFCGNEIHGTLEKFESFPRSNKSGEMLRE